MPMEQCVPCHDEQTNCSEIPQKKTKSSKKLRDVSLEVKVETPQSCLELVSPKVIHRRS